jgi:DNA-binding MarR family transcriptional regulator
MQVNVKQLSSAELGAWRGFLRVHAAIVRRLDAELEAEHGLSLSAYEVLLLLHEAPGRRLRMSQLADSALLSHSGMTRLVDRLVKAGLVQRRRCEEDRRGFFAEPTPAGTELFGRARATHLRGIRERFVSRLSERELAELGALWDRVA